MGFLDIFKVDKKKELAPAPVPPSNPLPPLPNAPEAFRSASLDLPPPPPLGVQTPVAQPTVPNSFYIAETPKPETRTEHDALNAALDALNLDDTLGKDIPLAQETMPLSEESPLEPPQELPMAPRKPLLDLPPVPEIPKEWGVALPTKEGDLQPLSEESKTPEIKKIEIPPVEIYENTANKVPSRIPDLDSFAEVPSLGNTQFEQMQEDLRRFDGPRFLKAEDFSTVTMQVNDLNNLVKDSERIFSRMKEIKSFKDKKLQEWQRNLEDIQRKLVYLDNKLFEVA